MADKPVTEVVAVDAVLDGLSSPTSSDVYEALGPFSNDAAIASAAKLALDGGGGGGSLPVGGTTGQVLTKESNADNDADWEDAEGLPTGWTQDGANPANVNAHNGQLTSVGLLSTALFQVSTVSIQVGSADPSAGGGLGGAVGSLYLRTNGQTWGKTGAGNTDWTQLGGTPAGALQVVRVPLAFDTANLVLTGITAYTPAVGDVLLDSSYLSVTTDWDGSTPGVYLYSNGDVPGSGDEIIQHYGLQAANAAQGSSTRNSIIQHTMGSMYLNASGGNNIIFDTTAALKLMVDDGASGDPVSTQGEGEFVLIIAPAA